MVYIGLSRENVLLIGNRLYSPIGTYASACNYFKKTYVHPFCSVQLSVYHSDRQQKHSQGHDLISLPKQQNKKNLNVMTGEHM